MEELSEPPHVGAINVHDELVVYVSMARKIIAVLQMRYQLQKKDFFVVEVRQNRQEVDHQLSCFSTSDSVQKSRLTKNIVPEVIPATTQLNHREYVLDGFRDGNLKVSDE